MCALIGAVAPVREAIPLEDPRTLGGVAAVGAAALVGWRQLRSAPGRRGRGCADDPDFVADPGSLIDAGYARLRGLALRRRDTLRRDPRVRRRQERRDRGGALPARGRRARAPGRVRPRARILVCSPTLRGYVSPIPVAAEEHLSGGDVASVVGAVLRPAHAADAVQGADRHAHARGAARAAA